MFAKQDTFNIAARGLLEQGRKSLSENSIFGKCVFRGPDGARCAVGFLIPDDLYAVSMESDLYEGLTCAASLGHDVKLCEELMLVHDKVPAPKWREALAQLAYEQGLDAAVVWQTKRHETALAASDTTSNAFYEKFSWAVNKVDYEKKEIMISHLKEKYLEKISADMHKQALIFSTPSLPTVDWVFDAAKYIVPIAPEHSKPKPAKVKVNHWQNLLHAVG